PDYFNGGKVQYIGSNQVNASGVDFSGGYGAGSDKTLWPVQSGDYIEFKGGGLVHLITTVGPSALQIATRPPYQIQATEDYRIIRRPRVLIGETPMQLPQDIVIDLNQSVNLGKLDLVFSPGGAR